MRFELVETKMGALSIRSLENNEILHNPLGPWLEAQRLHISATRLKELLQEHDNLVIYDVGLGAATNALAAIDLAYQSEYKGSLKILSFENNRELFEFAILNSKKFLHLEKYKQALLALQEQGSWNSKNPNISWNWIHGDFLETLDSVEDKADVIFYDPYSPLSNPKMWTLKIFRKLRSHCKSRAILSTYSISTAVRTALLLANFYVGYGPSLGAKRTSTVATVDPIQIAQILGPEWLTRWQRSSHPLPPDIDDVDFEEISRVLSEHPQFRKRS